MKPPQHLLEKHPTPWHIAEGYRLDGMGSDVMGRDVMGRDDMVETSRVWEVRDANTARVLPPCEPSPLIEELVDFINALGPRLPRLIQLDIQEKMRGVMRWENIERADEDELLRRINNLENRGGDSARQ